jgi:hypothetical protein
LFVSSIEGLVLRADLFSLLQEEETIVRNLQTIVSPIQFPINVPVNALLLSNNNNKKKKKGTTAPPSLPSYLRVMFRSSTSESRLTSLAVVPQSSGSEGTADSFRVFVVDANKEQLIALKESGGNDIRSYNSIAVGKQFQVYWPFQLLFFSSSSSSVSFILSEYFGEWQADY